MTATGAAKVAQVGKSTSGGVIYVVAGSSWYCVKGYSRLQSVVALSSAEAELFAIAEAAKEIAGLGQLAAHIWEIFPSPSPSSPTVPRPARSLGWRGSFDVCDMLIFGFVSFRTGSTRTS